MARMSFVRMLIRRAPDYRTDGTRHDWQPASLSPTGRQHQEADSGTMQPLT